jgi:hypothetical protein
VEASKMRALTQGMGIVTVLSAPPAPSADPLKGLKSTYEQTLKDLDAILASVAKSFEESLQNVNPQQQQVLKLVQIVKSLNLLLKEKVKE